MKKILPQIFVEKFLEGIFVPVNDLIWEENKIIVDLARNFSNSI